MHAQLRRRGGVGGIGLLILLAMILPLAVQELAMLFTAEQVRPYRVIAAIGSSLLILHAFLTQFPPFQPIAASTLAFIIVFIMLAAALRRAMRKQTQDAIVAHGRHRAGDALPRRARVVPDGAARQASPDATPAAFTARRGSS